MTEEYKPTPQQEQALREWLQEAIVPLIEQVLVKKLGQAMSFAAQEVVQPKKEWVGLTEDERTAIREGVQEWMFINDHRYGKTVQHATELKLMEKNQ